MCLVPLSQLTAIINTYSITCLVSIIDLGGALFETQTESLQLDENSVPQGRDAASMGKRTATFQGNVLLLLSV